MWIVEANLKNSESSIVANREIKYDVFVWVAAALQVEGDTLALSQRWGFWASGNCPMLVETLNYTYIF